MFLRRPILPLMAALVALTALSCNSLEPSEEQESVALYIELNNTTLSLGQSVAITVMARNVGLSPVVLTGPSDCLLYIEVWDTNSKRVYSSAGTCAGSTITEELAPGAEKTATVTWDGTQSGGQQLSGSFYIRPVALVAGSARVGPGTPILVVEQ